MSDDLIVPRLLDHQVEASMRQEPFQLLRWGRRAGKSVYGVNTGIMGRGPDAIWKGLRHGRDVIWVGRSHDQVRIIWNNEIKPRFQAADGYVNDTLHVATIPDCGMGSIRVCSQDKDSINNARGDGKNIGGVIGDEVAHWDDAESVWLEILLPMLTDNMGWATFLSTTKAGSWFNDQCEKVMAGLATAEWWHSYKTALDNPKISKDAFNRMVAEYPAGDARLDQEVWAKLIAGGAGAAFPEWRDDLHLKRLEPLPTDWRAIAGMDWGYAEPGAFELALVGPGGRVHVCLEVTFQGKTTEVVGREIALRCLESGILPEWIAYDSAMDHDGPTIVDELRAAVHKSLPSRPIPILPVSKGPGSRVSSKVFLHEAMRYTADVQGVVHAWGAPRLTIDPVRCPMLSRTLPRLQRATPEERDQNDIGRKPKQWDHCIAGDTPVLTATGWVAIRALPEAWIAGYDAETLTLWCGDRWLECTPDHRILTMDGWQEAQDLAPGMEILWWSPERFRSIGGGATTFAVDTSSAMECDSIVSCGRMQAEPFPQDTTSTIWTTTPRTIGWTTWRAGHAPATSLIIPPSRLTHSEQRDGVTPSDPVGTVIAVSRQHSAARRLSRVTAGKRQTVFDLSVLHPLHAFVVAHGFVVHNCYDALRYLFMMYHPTVSEPIQAIKNDRHPGFIPGTFERRDRWRTPEVEAREMMRSMEAQGITTGGRYQRPTE